MGFLSLESQGRPPSNSQVWFTLLSLEPTSCSPVSRGQRVLIPPDQLQNTPEKKTLRTGAPSQLGGEEVGCQEGAFLQR